jgi:hypothetical protein
MVKKVGDLKNQTETEPEQKGRQDFDIKAFGKENKDAVDKDGLLAVAPPTYNYRKHKPMKKEQFATEALYIELQALICGQKAEFFTQRGKELASKAERLKKFGSEKARRAAAKLAKAKDTIKTLREQLLATGMDENELDDIIENM